MTQNIRLSRWLRPLALLVAVAACVAGPARADIHLRVESRPNTDAIEAFVRVTEGTGPVTGLSAADFAVTLDGAALNTFNLTLPPDQDPTQRISVVVVITERLLVGSSILEAATDFINNMAVGDYAAVVKFESSTSAYMTLGFYLASPIVHSFTQIDGGAGTFALVNFISAPHIFNTRISGVKLYDGIGRAVGEYAVPTVALPNGPKAIILIGNDRDRFSSSTQSEVLAYANDSGIAVFTVGVGNMGENPEVNALMASVADDTGGSYIVAPNNAQIAETLVTVAGLLKNAYRLTIPQSAVTDCFPHVLAVTSQGQAESIAFTRCDSTPDELYFTNRENVAPGSVVLSDAVTITGIASPVAISVSGGEYSVDCNGTFTATSGYILPGSQVCVRHRTSVAFGDSTSTLLITGGVSSSFWSSTSAAPPPPPAGGGSSGGGATGVIELLLVLGTLLLRRRPIRGR